MVPLVMGVLNVTPDSFSDGGRFLDQDAAVRHGLAMIDEGAAVVDVGGESTRPGAAKVDEAEELRRVIPVVSALAAAGSARISIDTTKRAVAEAAVDAGATMVNDISATLWEVASAGRAAWVAMHMKGTPATMQSLAEYDDVVFEVCAFLADKAEAARQAGVSEVWVDPGLGFAKTAEHNLSLLKNLRRLGDLGCPVLVGASRKSFLGALTDDAPADDRLEASLAAAVWAAHSGASMVRVHDVRHTVHAMKLLTSASRSAEAAA